MASFVFDSKGLAILAVTFLLGLTMKIVPSFCRSGLPALSSELVELSKGEELVRKKCEVIALFWE